MIDSGIRRFLVALAVGFNSSVWGCVNVENGSYTRTSFFFSGDTWITKIWRSRIYMGQI